jgi:hypothetical protein
MPIIRDIRLRLHIDRVLRREGLPKNIPPNPAIQKVILEMLKDIEQGSLLSPAIAYEILPVEKIINDRDTPISSLISGSREIAAIVCTIGNRLEIRVKKYIESNKPLSALIMDGIGSAAVDVLSEEACNLIASVASSRGYMAGSPISPGMQGLPITGQKHLFDLIPAGEIGVSLTDSGTMIPLKSVSMIMGLGPGMKRWKRAAVCTICHLRNTCSHRLL